MMDEIDLPRPAAASRGSSQTRYGSAACLAGNALDPAGDSASVTCAASAGGERSLRSPSSSEAGDRLLADLRIRILRSPSCSAATARASPLAPSAIAAFSRTCESSSSMAVEQRFDDASDRAGRPGRSPLSRALARPDPSARSSSGSITSAPGVIASPIAACSRTWPLASLSASTSAPVSDGSAVCSSIAIDDLRP